MFFLSYNHRLQAVRRANADSMTVWLVRGFVGQREGERLGTLSHTETALCETLRLPASGTIAQIHMEAPLEFRPPAQAFVLVREPASG